MEEKKVFVASPSDVKRERDIVEQVLSSINLGMAADRNLFFKIYRWENEYPRGGDPQPIFTNKIQECSIFVAIFWRRIGTPRSKEYPSTVQEVQEALRLYKNNGIPEVMIYFSNKPFQSNDPEDYIQKAHVLEFQKRIENDPLWNALYKKYDDEDHFESIFRKDIENWLKDKFPIDRMIRNLKIKKSIKKKPIENDPFSVWSKCLSFIKDNVTLLTFNVWFLPIKPIELKEKTLTVSVPSTFFFEWIDEHYSTLVNNTIIEILGKDANIIYKIVEENEEKEDPKAIFIKKESPTQKFETYLNSRYTFGNFIKGECNQLARAAALAISDNPGETTFNPFFVYGGVGLGKTHVIQAVGNKILENLPDKRVIYLSSEIFTVEFVEAIQSNRVGEFSEFYKNMDVLIIDDIQFFIGKEKTQDSFFHIFNNLHQEKKQIILASDKPPKDLKGLEERLISRFQWGLIADIQPPDFETRLAILERKVEDYGMRVSNEILIHIASNITTNIRELEGCLVKLLAYASLNSKDITLSIAKKIVTEIGSDRKVNITIDSIIQIVCDYLNVDNDKIREQSRRKEIVFARQIAMYLTKELTKSSLKTIGLYFGGRDHSSVIHACKLIEEERLVDRAFDELINILIDRLKLSSNK